MENTELERNGSVVSNVLKTAMADVDSDRFKLFRYLEESKKVNPVEPNEQVANEIVDDFIFPSMTNLQDMIKKVAKRASKEKVTAIKHLMGVIMKDLTASGEGAASEARVS